MSLYEIDVPREHVTRAMLLRIKGTLRNVMRGMLYAQKIKAMLQLSGENLKSLRLTLSQILRYAHQCT